MKRKLLLVALLGSCLVIPTWNTKAAHAQQDAKTRALDAYKQGTKKYNLGKWQDAIALFEKAYELYPDAAFLFNIAQSYRQSDDCKQAAFFYKRYLAIKADAPNRVEVEGFIHDLDEACRLRGANNLTTPGMGETGNGTGEATTAGDDKGTDTGTGDAGTGDTKVADASGPVSSGKITQTAEPGTEAAPLLKVYAYAGPNVMLLDDDIGTQTRFNATLAVGYPITLGPVDADFGILASYSNFDWITEVSPGMDVDGTVGFTALMANVGAGKEVIDKLTVRGELGLGVMIFTGLDDDNNIFAEEEAYQGAVVDIAARVALGAEYSIIEGLTLSVQPLVYQIVPAPDGLVVDSFDSYQALVGLGYTL